MEEMEELGRAVTPGKTKRYWEAGDRDTVVVQGPIPCPTVAQHALRIPPPTSHDLSPGSSTAPQGSGLHHPHPHSP